MAQSVAAADRSVDLDEDRPEALDFAQDVDTLQEVGDASRTLAGAVQELVHGALGLAAPREDRLRRQQLQRPAARVRPRASPSSPKNLRAGRFTACTIPPASTAIAPASRAALLPATVVFVSFA